MKYQGFDSFLKEYARSLNAENTLSLFKSEKLVQNNSRFFDVFTFYLLLDCKAESTLLKYRDNLPNLYNHYLEFQVKYRGLNLSNLESFVLSLDDFNELKKLYNSYKNLKLNKVLTQKRMYLNEIKNNIKFNRLSKYRIYKDLNLNPGNTNDFIKNENIDKLSLENIEKIYFYTKKSSILISR